LRKRMKIAQWKKCLSCWNWCPLLYLGSREGGTGEFRLYTQWRVVAAVAVADARSCGTGPKLPRMHGIG
jgi:hypothetical protein